MATTCNTKRLSGVTNAEAAKTQPQKKAKPNQTVEERHWKHCLEGTNKDQVETLAKELFEELRKRNGSKVAMDIMFSNKRKIDVARNKHTHVAGIWVLDKDGGLLTIEDGIESAVFNSSSVDVGDLRLESDKSSDTLVYGGDADWWDSCRDEFEVELSFKFDIDRDTIKGTINVTPLRGVSYGPPSAYGGSINFNAVRQDDDSE